MRRAGRDGQKKMRLQGLMTWCEICMTRAFRLTSPFIHAYFLNYPDMVAGKKCVMSVVIFKYSVEQNQSTP